MIGRQFSLAGIAIASGFCWAMPAEAKPGDKAWATCVWQTAPASAKKWSAMTPPSWQEPFESLASSLGLRLAALCGTEAANPLRPNRYYNFKSLASALRAARPAVPGEADNPVAITELCSAAIAGDGGPFTFRYDVVRVDGGTRITTFQQYYTQANGLSLRLPQDLRILPKPDQVVTTTCRRISTDGSLIDA